MSLVRIALCQAQSGIDPAANAERLTQAVREAAQVRPHATGESEAHEGADGQAELCGGHRRDAQPLDVPDHDGVPAAMGVHPAQQRLGLIVRGLRHASSQPGS